MDITEALRALNLLIDLQVQYTGVNNKAHQLIHALSTLDNSKTPWAYELVRLKAIDLEQEMRAIKTCHRCNRPLYSVDDVHSPGANGCKVYEDLRMVLVPCYHPWCCPVHSDVGRG
jgi:hypothetical protein